LGNFKSGLEAHASELLGKLWSYESGSFLYVWPRRYRPDFTRGELVFEVKGRFRPGDSGRYPHVRDAIHADGKLLVFVITNWICKACFEITRWCLKHNIPVIVVEDLPTFKKCKTKEEFYRIYRAPNLNTTQVKRTSNKQHGIRKSRKK